MACGGPCEWDFETGTGMWLLKTRCPEGCRCPDPEGTGGLSCTDQIGGPSFREDAGLTSHSVTGAFGFKVGADGIETSVLLTFTHFRFIKPIRISAPLANGGEVKLRCFACLLTEFETPERVHMVASDDPERVSITINAGPGLQFTDKVRIHPSETEAPYQQLGFPVIVHDATIWYRLAIRCFRE